VSQAEERLRQEAAEAGNAAQGGQQLRSLASTFCSRHGAVACGRTRLQPHDAPGGTGHVGRRGPAANQLEGIDERESALISPRSEQVAH